MATLIRVDDRIDVPDRLPVVALRDLVFFPYVVLPILVGRHRSVAALDEAREEEGMVLLLAQKDPGVDEPGSADLFRVGTVARALQVSKLPDGTSRVVLEGLGRVRVRRLVPSAGALRAAVEPFACGEVEAAGTEPDDGLVSLTASVAQLYREYARLHERIPDEISDTLDGS